MNKNTIWMLGAGMGAGLMYLFDPDRGRRRRALLRDQLMHAASQLRDAIETTSRDVVNRAYGVAAEAKSRFSSEQADDATLEARVRSEIGWAVSHPKAIEVRTQGGWVTLSGPVLAHELDNLLRVAASVRGVSGVKNQLQVHEHPGSVSSLQGGRARPRSGERFELMQENWSPAARLITGLVGSSLDVAWPAAKEPCRSCVRIDRARAARTGRDQFAAQTCSGSRRWKARGRRSEDHSY